ncbi:MAG: ThiF family adenylyltransferase [Gemmataceae bacterium]|nr:ThiF family adenylyltransferase [Gemmataceae bacterium]
MSHVFQVGAGSGGIVVLDLVARDPRVRRVTLVEPDVYKAHNVHRHLFGLAAVGRMKAELAAEWVRERRPDVQVETVAADLTDPKLTDTFARLAAECDVGVCAVDNEPAKYAFDALMRASGKPWTLGEVLSGGIGGWVHRFTPGGPCYGCVASHLQRTVTEQPAGPAPDYSAPGGPVAEATIPASKASIGVIAGLHAVVTLGMLNDPGGEVPGRLHQPAVHPGGGPGGVRRGVPAVPAAGREVPGVSRLLVGSGPGGRGGPRCGRGSGAGSTGWPLTCCPSPAPGRTARPSSPGTRRPG